MIKKILNNPILMSWARGIVGIVGPMFIFPLVLVVYSDIEQSFYLITSAIIGLALMADSGFGSTTVRAVAYFRAGADYIPRTKKEYDEAEDIKDNTPNLVKLKNLLSTTKRIYLILNIVLFLIMSIGGVAVIWNIMKQSGHRIDLWLAYGLLLPYAAITIGNIRWSSFMRGLDYVAQEARFNTLVNAMRMILFVIFLSFKLKPVYLSIGYIGEALVTRIYLRNFVINWFKMNNVFKTKGKVFDNTIFKSLWSASWRNAVIQWGNYFVEQGNSIIVAQISDVKLMANFLFTIRLLRMTLNFSKTTLFAKIPLIFKLSAEKRTNELRQTASRYIFLGLCMAFSSYFVLGAVGNLGLELLHTDRRLMPLFFFAIMALTEILDMHSSFHASIYTSTNHIPFLLPTIISGAVIFLVGYNVVMPIYGIMGIILLRFFVQLAFNNWYAVYLNLKFLHWPLFSYFYEMPFFGIKWITMQTRRIITRH